MEMRINNRMRGYTMVELITVVVILGIVAAITVPRFFDRAAFESRGFYDQVIASLRYAQKAAIAQHRNVCIGFGANPASVTLTQVTSGNACPGAAPANNLASPAGGANYVVSTSNASFAALPTNFFFDALGKPYNYGDIPPASTFVKQTITVSGYANPLYVEPETGYVHP